MVIPAKKMGIYLLMITLVISCKTLGSLDNLNLAHLYNPEINVLLPQYHITHNDKQNSTLTLKIPSEQLLYVRELQDDYFNSRFTLHYRLLDYSNSRNIIDSETHFFMDSLGFNVPYVITREMNIQTRYGKDKWLYVELEDNHRKSKHTHLLYVEKEHSYAAPFFNLVDTLGNIYFSPFHIGESNYYTLSYYDTISFDLNISYYPKDSTLPLPPFIEADHSTINHLMPESDTTYLVSFQKGLTTLFIDKPGMYRLHHPEDSTNGFILNFPHTDFPGITKAENMILPLRYVSTGDEFEKATQLGDASLAVDRFWTQVGGNPDRAAELIRRYYHRVEQANKYFTSFREGWQTDRGLIYIVFGTPHMVFRTPNKETWLYQQTIRTPNVRFTFHKPENIYSHNHYILERKPEYRINWNHAMDNWRR